MNSVLAHQDMLMKVLVYSNRRATKSQRYTKAKGFSLIELVITIVVLGIAVTALSSSLFTAVGRNADPLWQSKATQLSQVYLDEILSMRYDETSPLGGGSTGVVCAIGGTDGETSRSLYDDVDDYNGLTETADFLDTDASSNYTGYSVSIAVTCVDHLNVTKATTDTKLIAITITSPTNQSLVFSVFRADL